MQKEETQTKQQKLISLCKRRGFIYPSSEIYGGLGSVYDYGPMGVELLKNIKELWWKTFVHKRVDVVGMESQILMHPTVWKASGHVDGFSDPMIECKECKSRFRADHLIEEFAKDVNADGMSNEALEKTILDQKIKCPNCEKLNWTSVRNFNQLFETSIGSLAEDKSKVYLRGETAQGQFVQFKNVLDSVRKKIPFGIAQIGKAFRNEITKGKFVFRTLEFEQMEIEYFIKEPTWTQSFEDWRKLIKEWYVDVLGISEEKFKWQPHHPDKLAHYAKKAEDYEYNFSTGFGEVSGLHYRTDFDLGTHQKYSGADLTVNDLDTNEKFLPHVIEATFGLNRNLFMVLDNAYYEDGERVVLRLPKKLAPYKAAVFPLVRNKDEIVAKAREVFEGLLEKGIYVAWDDRGNIGKRYLSADEVGTPACITIDYQTLEDGTVTIRDRDTTKQERIKIEDIKSYL